jgi:hypothetical protein
MTWVLFTQSSISLFYFILELVPCYLVTEMARRKIMILDGAVSSSSVVSVENVEL